MALLDSPGKADVIFFYAEEYPDINVLVETGTVSGDQPFLARHLFDRIISIEMDDDLYTNATARLMPYENITVCHGDSAVRLSGILTALDEPCILWLDAHEVVDNGSAAMAAEMNAIAHSDHRHVILIDDARLCNGKKGWMTLEQIEEWCDTYGYTHAGIEDDIIRILP